MASPPQQKQPQQLAPTEPMAELPPQPQPQPHSGQVLAGLAAQAAQGQLAATHAFFQHMQQQLHHSQGGQFVASP